MAKIVAVALLAVLLQVLDYGLALDLQSIRPIYENAYWRKTHPALDKWISRSELAYKVLGSKLPVVPTIGARVTGGQEANPNQFPYQAGLVVTLPTQESFCGGSLISINYVLTAAHCLDTSTFASVLLGAHNVSMNSETTRQIQLLGTRHFKIHENYNATQYQFDIALLQLTSPVTLNSAVSLINLPRLAQADTSFAANVATISGWGRYLDTTDLLSDVLRYVDLTILDNSACTPFFGTAVTAQKICSSGANRVGPCGGRIFTA